MKMQDGRYTICEISSAILEIGFFAVTVLLLYIVFYLDTAQTAPEMSPYIVAECGKMLEYAFATALVTVFGAAVFDIEYKKAGGKLS